MTEPENGYEYLEMLRRQDNKRTVRFGDFSEYLESKARVQGIPITGQLELTPLCNLDCRMCYVHLPGNRLSGQSLLSPAQWKDLIRQAYECGMYTSTLTGGECLTYPGFEEVFLYLHSLGCQVDLMTNGVLLNEERMRFFKKHPPAFIQITLYGAGEDAYERVTGRRVFGTVMENIRRIQEAGILLAISITPNPYLGEDVFETIRLARSITDNVFINTSLFTPDAETGREEGFRDLDQDSYIRILRFNQELRGFSLQTVPEDQLPAAGGPEQECRDCGLKCGGGRSGFVIDWRGAMRICNRLPAKSWPLRDGFREAWRSINQTAEKWPAALECRGCAYEQVCDRCAAKFYELERHGKRPAEVCERIKYMVSRGVLPSPECD